MKPNNSKVVCPACCHQFTAICVDDQRVRRGAKQEIERLRDKTLRFDLDIAGIERREAEAVELVELRSENERLRAECVARATAIATLHDEIERLRKDAERYRWLRSNITYCEMTGWRTTVRDIFLDNHIDAALRREEA